MNDRHELNCPYCGANIPLLYASSVRCPYCLNKVEVSQEIRQPLMEVAGAKAELDDTLDRLQDKRRGIQFQALFIAGCGLVYLIPIVFTLSEIISTAKAGGDPGRLFTTAFFGVGIYSIVFMAFAVTAFRWRPASMRQLARLPLSVLKVEKTITPHCGNCGSELTVPLDEITTTCVNCGTVSLLPATLVSDNLQRKHAQIMEVRIKGEAMDANSNKWVSSSGRIVGWGCISLGVLDGILGPSWNVLIVPVKPKFVSGEITESIVIACFILGMGVVFVICNRDEKNLPIPVSSQSELASESNQSELARVIANGVRKEQR